MVKGGLVKTNPLRRKRQNARGNEGRKDRIEVHTERHSVRLVEIVTARREKGWKDRGKKE